VCWNRRARVISFLFFVSRNECVNIITIIMIIYVVQDFSIPTLRHRRSYVRYVDIIITIIIIIIQYRRRLHVRQAGVCFPQKRRCCQT